MSYHPVHETFYVPINLNCEDGDFRTGRQGSGRRRHRPGAPHEPHAPGQPRRVGRAAGDEHADRRNPLALRTRTPIQHEAALTTAGDIVVAGDWDRQLYVFDAENGDILWQTRLPHVAAGLSPHLRGRRHAVHRRACRYRGRQLGHLGAGRSPARQAASRGRERRLRVRAAVISACGWRASRTSPPAPPRRPAGSAARSRNDVAGFRTGSRVVPLVRVAVGAHGGALEADARKQAARPRIAEDLGRQQQVGRRGGAAPHGDRPATDASAPILNWLSRMRSRPAAVHDQQH